MMIKEYRYIYNPQQALFYMQRGLVPQDIGTNDRTNKQWFKFKDSNTLQNIYKMWMDRKYKSENNFN